MTELRKPILELQDVSLARGSHRILDRICWSVSQGEHTALLGPNGCGKSTLLKLITRVMYPSVVDGEIGSVRMFGETEWNVWDLRSRLGMVSSELDQHFLAGRSGRLTTLQAVLTGFFSSELEPDEELVTPLMLSRATDALHRVEIASLAERPMGHLSTGERRRVMLARALIHEPQTLILDEPTSGLDIRAQDQLLRHLEDLAGSGTTLIIVTHHFEEVLPCVTRTVLMQSGRIVFDGPTDKAMHSDLLSSIFQSPLSVARTSTRRWLVRLIDPTD